MTGSGASPASAAAGSSAVRSGELFAALSLATDLGTGQAAEHGLRTCLLALELAELAGLDAQQVRGRLLPRVAALDRLHRGRTSDRASVRRRPGAQGGVHADRCWAAARDRLLPLAQRLSHRADTPTCARLHQRAGRRPRLRARQPPQSLRGRRTARAATAVARALVRRIVVRVRALGREGHAGRCGR